MRELALLMYERGCQVAFNLDGGKTGAICFMGKKLNQLPQDDSEDGVRPTGEILAFGTSGQVGSLPID